MKKKLSILLILVVIPVFQFFAQNNFKPETWIGTTQGVTLSSVTLSPKVKQDLLTGYNGGFFIRHISEKYFGFQVELNYSMRGWKETMENTPQYSYQRRMGYVEVPFLTHIYFGDKVKGYINLGPKFAYFLHENEKINFDPENAPGLIYTAHYLRPTETKFDYGICGGGGIILDTGIGQFALEGRYYLGLGDFFKSGSTSEFNSASMQSISINITYARPLKKR